MIKVKMHDGEVICNGSIDEILMEYTVLTKLLLKQISELTNEEKAFNILAKLGQIAADGYNKSTNYEKIWKEIDKVLTDEMQI